VAISASDLGKLKQVTELARRFAELKAPRPLEPAEPLGAEAALEAELEAESLRRDLLASLDEVDPLVMRLAAGPRA
jgi:hypothetical protein